MMNNYRWAQYLVFLPFWQKRMLSFFAPVSIALICFIFIFTHYFQAIEKQQTAITQSQIRIKQYQSTLHNMPSITSLKALQSDYQLPFNPLSADERLQQILNKHQFIPDSWEYDSNTFYKLGFTLSYARFLMLLEQISQGGFSLSSINVMPINLLTLSVQLHLIDLNQPTSPLLLSETS
ncbi:hypothetical protein [Proteus hauseri]|uniref:hypothetical protein n=1 Tax=Proteus hauseri TaxID=183417 RepID=UPI0032D9D8DD